MDDNRDIMMLLAMRDSILHTFFQILWEKSRTRKTLSTVRIPDTIVFSHSRVADWYFTSRDGSIRKKSHLKLSSANVMEQLEKRAKKNKSCVVGVVLERDPSREDGLKTRHMDLASVRQHLGEGGGSGTLQSFVEPKTESGAVHNNEIVLNWTPNVLYVEKKRNLCDIAKESKGSLDERTTVEETAKNVAVTPLVSTRVTAELEAVCQDIALHIEVISKPSVRLASIGLHVKVDANDNLWVLFCSNIRIVSVEGPSRVMSVGLLAGRQESTGTNSKNSGATSPRRSQPVARSSAREPAPKAYSSPETKPTSSDCSTASSSDTESTERLRPVHRASAKDLRRGASVSPSRQTSTESSHDTVCTICVQPLPHEEAARVVPKRHILFPLSIIAFFATNPPGTRYVDVVASSRAAAVVPEFVQLIHPNITLAEYATVRRTEEWLAEPMLLCDACADGLRDVTASLQLERDGSIVVPRSNPKPAGIATQGDKPPTSRPVKRSVSSMA